MELKEVLAQVPGLHKRFVYYLESQGYIHPVKVRKQRIARRDYAAVDLRTIREVWRYYQRGYAVAAAHELATRTERATAYVALQVPAGQQARALEWLRSRPEVVEAAVVYAATLDLIMKTDTPEEGDIYHALTPLLAQAGLSGVPRVLRVQPGFRRDLGAKEEQTGMMAYILIEAPGKNVDQVMATLKELPGVVEASTVYGEEDIIAKLRVADQGELDRLVMEQVHGIPGVVSTRTFIVVSNMYWSRERA